MSEVEYTTPQYLFRTEQQYHQEWLRLSSIGFAEKNITFSQYYELMMMWEVCTILGYNDLLISGRIMLNQITKENALLAKRMSQILQKQYPRFDHPEQDVLELFCKG